VSCCRGTPEDFADSYAGIAAVGKRKVARLAYRREVREKQVCQIESTQLALQGWRRTGCCSWKSRRHVCGRGLAPWSLLWWAVMSCMQLRVSAYYLAKLDYERLRTDRTFRNSLFDLFHLDFAHTLDFAECLGCCSMNRL
jgi:hypothetical protein